MKSLILLLFCLCASVAISQNNSIILKQEQLDSLAKIFQTGLNDTLLNNQKTAIAVAEAILFNVYGKEQIESEKPYNITYEKGYWYISGSLPKSGFDSTTNTITIVKGGVFSIKLDAKDGKATVFPHGK